MSKLSLSIYTRRQTKQRKKKTQVIGNISKRGELLLSRTRMIKLGIDEHQPIVFAQSNPIKANEFYMLIPPEKTAHSINFVRVSKAWGLPIPGILDKLDIDFETRNYMFEMQVVPEEDIPTFRVVVEVGRLHL